MKLTKPAKLTKLAAIFPGLIFAACSAPPPLPPPQIIALPSRVDPGQGIDLATDASDVLNELQASRLEFVARYYRTPESRWPPLSASEAQRLSALGLKIVAVWEAHSRDPAHFSYFYGYNDAMMAYLQARAVGQPAGSAIYFAVDFNAPRGTLAAIDDYFRGVAAGFAAASGGHPDYMIGVYGSGAVCDDVKRTGLARYSWLSNSFAWIDSTGYEDWNIRQGSRSPDLSFNHDSDEAKEEYGAFQLANSGVAASDNPVGPRAFAAPQGSQDGQPLVSAITSAR
ncbi:MAG: glycoside hydrolase domain-containing protein [Stellaceae bacterium]